MAETVLEFREVIKRFGTQVAVDQVSFSIEPGETFTLLGLSGRGKTHEHSEPVKKSFATGRQALVSMRSFFHERTSHVVCIAA